MIYHYSNIKNIINLAVPFLFHMYPTSTQRRLQGLHDKLLHFGAHLPPSNPSIPRWRWLAAYHHPGHHQWHESPNRCLPRLCREGLQQCPSSSNSRTWHGRFAGHLFVGKIRAKRSRHNILISRKTHLRDLDSECLCCSSWYKLCFPTLLAKILHCKAGLEVLLTCNGETYSPLPKRFLDRQRPAFGDDPIDAYHCLLGDVLAHFHMFTWFTSNCSSFSNFWRWHRDPRLI